MVIVSIPPTITQPPVATSGNLHSTVNLTCRAIGNPIPTILWYKDNVLISNDNNDPSVLMFNELSLNDRGFYHCEARSIIDGHVISVNSSNVILNISGVVITINIYDIFHLIINTDVAQYGGELQLPKDYYESTNQTTSEILSTLILQVLYIST